MTTCGRICNYFNLSNSFTIKYFSTWATIFKQKIFWNLYGWVTLIFGLTARYLPFAIVIVLLYRFSLDKRLLEAGQILLRNDYQNKNGLYGAC